MKVLLVIVNILLFLIGSYFIYESIMQKNIYNSLKKRKPEKVKVNLYKKGKYEFEFSNNITTKHTIPYFALAVPVSKDDFLHAGNDNKIKTLGCSYKIYNTNNKQVFSKELEFNDICFVKTTSKQSMLHLGSIKWLPSGKYKIVFNVYSSCSENLLNGCDLLFIRHIASGELTGTIFLYQLLGVSFFVVGIILASVASGVLERGSRAGFSSGVLERGSRSGSVSGTEQPGTEPYTNKSRFAGDGAIPGTEPTGDGAIHRGRSHTRTKVDFELK